MDKRAGRREHGRMLEAGLEWSGAASKPRRRRSAAERRRIVEETLAPGSSVAEVAREHGVNANQVFQWRRLYRDGRLTGVRRAEAKLLPVTVADAAPPPAWECDTPSPADAGLDQIARALDLGKQRSNGSTMLAEIPGSQTATPIYHLNDHLGSLVGLADSNQNFTGPNDFTPYGEALAQAAANPFLFAGLEHDSDTSTEHATFRNLSSTQGRWLRPDPSDQSYDLGHPESLNRYAYVNGQTGLFTDPSGQNENGGGVPIPINIATIDLFSSILDQPPTINLQRLIRRPNSATADPWSETLGLPATGPPLQNPGLAGALGLPTASGCEFGACGNSLTPSGNTQQVAVSGSVFVLVFYFVGFEVTFAPLLGTHATCIGGGPAAGVGGLSASGGVVTNADGNLLDVLKGGSLSLSATQIR